jgi:histidyl-tRNA synthetase
MNMNNSDNKSEKLFMADPVKGFKDIQGPMAFVMEKIVEIATNIGKKYGLGPINTPIVERENLFVKSLGNTTDIVTKEIFRIVGDDNLILRPEQTSSIIRWAIKTRMDLTGQPRLYSYGPMFRHENPQKGRWRQFHQFNVEFINNKSIISDVELIMMTNDIVKKVSEQFQLDASKFVLKINWIGTIEERQEYSSYLQKAIQEGSFSPEAKEKAKSNPLRVLDTKNPDDLNKLVTLKTIEDFFKEDSANQWNQLKKLLDDHGVGYQWDPYLVRGLDYYNNLVFEWVVDGDEITKTAVIAGGRYDYLAYQLTEKYNLSCVGFAIGVDRWTSYILDGCSMETKTITAVCNIDASDSYVVKVANQLRSILNVQVLNPRKLSDHFNFIDNNGSYGNKVVILGSLEEEEGSILIKDLETKGQQKILLNQVESYEWQ